MLREWAARWREGFGARYRHEQQHSERWRRLCLQVRFAMAVQFPSLSLGATHSMGRRGSVAVQGDQLGSFRPRTGERAGTDGPLQQH